MIRGDIVNVEDDFWALYPEYKILEEFKDIQKQFKKESSKVMWFIVLCYHNESKFRGLELESRQDLLSKDLMKDSKWYKDNNKYLLKAIDLFYKIIDTPAKRQLRAWNLLLDKRTKFIDTIEYDFSTFEDIDKMAEKTDKIMIAFDKIMKLVEKENNEVNARGGAQPSLADSDEI